jgi:hypothetical protein
LSKSARPLLQGLVPEEVNIYVMWIGLSRNSAHLQMDARVAHAAEERPANGSMKIQLTGLGIQAA